MNHMIFFFSDIDGRSRRQSRLIDSISLTLSLRHNLIARPYRIAHCQSGDEWPPAAAPGGRLAPGSRAMSRGWEALNHPVTTVTML